MDDIKTVAISIEFIQKVTIEQPSLIDDAAEWLYNGYRTEAEEGVDFASLDDQRKIDIIDTHIRRVLADTANAQKVARAQNAAMQSVERERYSL